MSQCEGMQVSVKAGNVTALGRKDLMVFRKHAAAGAVTWTTFDCSLVYIVISSQTEASVCTQVEEESVCCL